MLTQMKTIRTNNGSQQTHRQDTRSAGGFAVPSAVSSTVSSTSSSSAHSTRAPGGSSSAPSSSVLWMTLILAIICTLATAASSSAASTNCDGSISMYVPAVVGEGGGLVKVVIELRPNGVGNNSDLANAGNENELGAGTYVSVYPRTGTMTQDSIREAVGQAYALAGMDQSCDVLVRFIAPASTGYMEGPSAGIALTTMAYALVEDKQLRNDTIITGAIGPGGVVEPVGGLYEKAHEAARRGAKYFITPIESVYETFLMKGLEEETGIKVLQAARVQDVIGFMTEGKPIVQQGLAAKKRAIPELNQYMGGKTDIENFKPVAAAMVALEKQQLEQLLQQMQNVDGTRTRGKQNENGNGTVSTGGNDDGAGSNRKNGTDGSYTDVETIQIKEVFDNELNRQTAILNQGYYFSAANEAFLNYIELSTLKALISDEVDIPRKKGDIGICLSHVPKPAMTDTNFEWVIGANLRENWALEKLNESADDEGLLKDEKYAVYNDLMYGEAWCKVARSIGAATPSTGRQINESAWKPLAEKKLEEVRELVGGDEKGEGSGNSDNGGNSGNGLTSEELTFRLNSAERAYSKGEYGAAIYDAVYIITMETNGKDQPQEQKGQQQQQGQGQQGQGQEQSWQQTQNSSSGSMNQSPNLVHAANEVANETRSSLWGKIYQSQGVFLYNQNDTAGARRIFAYAQALDNITEEMMRTGEYAYSDTKSTNPGASTPTPTPNAGTSTGGTGTETNNQVGIIAKVMGQLQSIEQTQVLQTLPTAVVHALVLVLVFAIILIFLLIGFSIGSKHHGNHIKGTGKAHRAQQKKGRA